MNGLIVTAIVIGVIFYLFLMVLWILLPFIVLKIHRRLRKMEAIMAANSAGTDLLRPLLTDISEQASLTNRILAAAHNVDIGEE